jgi:hypothetical protein
VHFDNKTEYFLGIATLANLCVVAWFFFIKPPKPGRYPAPPVAVDCGATEGIKEDLFFRSLLDENRQSPSNTTIATSGPRLLMRFSFRNCDLCINSAIAELQRVEKAFGQENILLTGTFQSVREFEIFEGSGKSFAFSCVNVPADCFGLHAERDASQPFFFVLFPDGSVRHVFFPMKEEVGRTRKYLRVIGERYFQKFSI